MVFRDLGLSPSPVGLSAVSTVGASLHPRSARQGVREVVGCREGSHTIARCPVHRIIIAIDAPHHSRPTKAAVEVLQCRISPPGARRDIYVPPITRALLLKRDKPIYFGTSWEHVRHCTTHEGLRKTGYQINPDQIQACGISWFPKVFALGRSATDCLVTDLSKS